MRGVDDVEARGRSRTLRGVPHNVLMTRKTRVLTEEGVPLHDGIFLLCHQKYIKIGDLLC